MSLHTSNAGGGDFKPCPEGMHLARCFKIIDLGTHMIPQFGKEAHKARIYFELPKTLMAEGEMAGQPFILNKQYTLSHHEKSILRIDLQNWYGKRFDTKGLDAAGGFDLAKLLGRPALINVVHSEDGKFANIASINPLPEGMECPPQVYPSFIFTLEDFNPVDFAKLSTKMQEHIKKSGEYIKLHTERSVDSDHGAGDDRVDGLDSDIPF
mgnify:CR=1 FL=1